MIARLSTDSADFRRRFAELIAYESTREADVEATVRHILKEVRTRGDEALIEFTNRFDDREVAAIDELEIRDRAAICAQVAPDLAAAVQRSAERIRAFHQRQVQETWTYTDETGIELGQRITPLERVGVYVPGGKAAYPSSVLMNVIPAVVAGVEEVIMVVPAPRGTLEPVVIYAADVAGVSRIITVGGAQAVGALTYGTQTIPKVDKIVGPGNQYVATAKAMVFGTVGIDMVAGPSEILIVSDGSLPAAWAAMDLFSQAEHDELAQSILLCPDASYLDAVEKEISRALPSMERRSIIETSLRDRGALIKVRDLAEAAELVNEIAPEHLELAVADPDQLLPAIRHAGAIFLGTHTPEAFGDYCLGPNHVLPTARTARFSSPLGVYDFQKRTSLMRCTAASAAQISETASTFARGEHLTAHARSAELRAAKS